VTSGPDPFQLRRFLDAQDGVIDTAVAELRAGRKQGHWMWFVFPQMGGLGQSPTAEYYAIRSIHEARAYLAHPILGERLRVAVDAILGWASTRTVAEILGDVDAMKLRSSLTLFEAVSGDPLFALALDAFFEAPDETTLRLIGQV
jgi:uncharacterized protein (DUF1810 family)